MSVGIGMSIHTLHTKQRITATLDQAWGFFSNPRNLSRITPPDMGFTVTTPDLPERIYAGMMISYRVRPLLSVPLTWLTEITQVREKAFFVDEQRVGPYAVWHHEHAFREVGDGLVEIEDRVTYVLPFGLLGNVVHPWLVKPQLARIFAYREKAVRELFPG